MFREIKREKNREKKLEKNRERKLAVPYGTKVKIKRLSNMTVPVY